MFRLDDKVCIVTGSATGIGFEIARIFTKQGARVFLFDISVDKARLAAGKINDACSQKHKAEAISCDVTKKSSVKRAFDVVFKRAGVVDILCNNAGIGHVGNILNADEDDLHRVMEVNVKGLFLCTKHAVRAMVESKRGGVILNIGSCASVHPIKDRVVYAASKGAVLTMTQSIATDHVGDGVRCNCICPGRVHTPFVDGFIKKNYPGNEKKMFKRLSDYMPQGRMLTPGEVGALALYLCSDEARMVTGASFSIDGGIVGVDHPKVYDEKVKTHPSFRAAL